MTFVVGMRCLDGIVLCTDSHEDDGITKKAENKIRLMGTPTWGLAIAGSGLGPTIDRFADAINKKVLEGNFDIEKMESELETELADFNSKYVLGPSDRFHVIVAAYNSQKILTGLHKASCFEGQGVVLSPVSHDCHMGMGNELWRLIADTLYAPRNSVADNLRLAVFATRLAIKYAAGVDEPVQAVSYTGSTQFWEMHDSAEIETIESELALDGFKKALKDYWRLHNPPSRWDQLRKYGSIRSVVDELISLDGVKPEELCTVVGRRRASKIFRRNEDKLQQRALLERKRYQAAQSGASQFSGGKSHT